MILRRVIKHFREQEWTAIFLDFLIVVVGVFVGLQVNNWNEALTEKVQEQHYLERLRTDLLTDIANLEGREQYWLEVLAEGDAAIAYAEHGLLKNCSVWETALAFFQASQMFQYYPVNPTYQELRSAGELGLISNQDIREGLANYYSTSFGIQEDSLLRLSPKYRDTIRGMTPSHMSRYIWLECHEELGIKEQRFKTCEPPFSDAESQKILDYYMKEPMVIVQLRAWIINLDVALRLARLDRVAANNLSKSIASLNNVYALDDSYKGQ